jgi:hypothetical protein
MSTTPSILSFADNYTNFTSILSFGVNSGRCCESSIDNKIIPVDYISLVFLAEVVTTRWGQFIFLCILTSSRTLTHTYSILTLTWLLRLLRITHADSFSDSIAAHAAHCTYMTHTLTQILTHLTGRVLIPYCTYIASSCSLVPYSRPYKFIIYNIYSLILVITCR